MTARLFVRNVDADMEEILTFPSLGWTTEESAEEGNASSTTIAIPDPDLSIDPDHIMGWRRAIVYEDESESDDQVLFSGFVSIQEFGRTGGEYVEPLGRVISVSLVDMNTLWDQRLLIGDDTDRGDETDVARMTWLVGTEEMGYFDNLDYLFSDDPEDLDERDVARTTCKSVADECSQQSGKNYWIGATGNVTDGTDIFVWYGHDSLEEYTSPLSLSNEPSDWDDDELAAGTSLVYPLSFDTKLSRDPNRVYDGANVEYEGGAEYRKEPATTAFFTLSGRDISVPAPEIKTAARAQRRGDRMLADLDTQDEIVTTTVRVPATKATMIRAGMRILVKATHLPGWELFGFARILKCQVAPAAIGNFYDLTLTLQGPTLEGPALETINLVATNTVTSDSGRVGTDQDGTLNFESGQVWRYTITNTAHDPFAYTQSLALVWRTTTPPGAYTVARGWGFSIYYVGPGFPDPGPDQGLGAGAPYPIMPEQTGTFAITAAGVGDFLLQGQCDYAPGVVTVDEQWTCVLERIA
jgi:hypothetical protein